MIKTTKGQHDGCRCPGAYLAPGHLQPSYWQPGWVSKWFRSIGLGLLQVWYAWLNEGQNAPTIKFASNYFVLCYIRWVLDIRKIYQYWSRNLPSHLMSFPLLKTWETGTFDIREATKPPQYLPIINMNTSYQLRNFHLGDQTILRPSYLYTGNSHHNMHLYWIQIPIQKIFLISISDSDNIKHIFILNSTYGNIPLSCNLILLLYVGKWPPPSDSWRPSAPHPWPPSGEHWVACPLW